MLPLDSDSDSDDQIEIPTLFLSDANDPDEDLALLLFHSAQLGSISGMENAIEKDPEIIYALDIFHGKSALHLAAESRNPAAVNAVRWLLEKGVPWSTSDMQNCIAEELAMKWENKESCRILREWAIQREYELHYKIDRGEGNPDEGKPLSFLRLDKNYENDLFCKSQVRFTNPHGTSEDEIALVCDPAGTGIMMEWERPIMCESARLLLDGLPRSGIRVLNIGFGIGMIDTYFQDAHPAEHVIIEGHPTCLKWMRHKGWYDRPGIRILEGRWQDFFPPSSDAGVTSNPIHDFQPLSSSRRELNIDIGKFDVVYFDTFHEGYRGHFAFIKHVPRLLRGPDSRFSFFNGHAVKHEIKYKIYAEVARLHHNDLGLNTEWSEVHVENETWENIRECGQGRRLQHPYLIPICTLAPTVPRTLVPGVGWNTGYAEPVNVRGTVD